MSFEQSVRQIVQDYDLVLLVTFGSYKTERFTDRSDIDVGYVSRSPLDVREQLGLLGDLVVLFKRDGIDLVDLSRANPLLLYEVASNSRVLYEEEDSYLKFKLKASARYADTKFLRQLRKEYLNSLIRETGE
ncbi:MAG TPA: nucleotidyltransferase domain-containing protein [Firmicutes bacterium]|jgi:predicted nucleotidyltransferase|nr:nucleotidyltransferase domain-containing protein [Bacillota bacterium]